MGEKINYCTYLPINHIFRAFVNVFLWERKEIKCHSRKRDKDEISRLLDDLQPVQRPKTFLIKHFVKNSGEFQS